MTEDEKKLNIFIDEVQKLVDKHEVHHVSVFKKGGTVIVAGNSCVVCCAETLLVYTEEHNIKCDGRSEESEEDERVH